MISNVTFATRLDKVITLPLPPEDATRRGAETPV